MIAAVWRKHWMELRGRLTFLMAFALLPAVGVAAAITARQGSYHGDVGIFLLIFPAIVLTSFPAQLGGTGLTTAASVHAQRGADPSLLFTLSLPVRRRTLFFYRSVFGLLAVETAAAVAWAVSCLLLVHVGASWHALVPGLWVLPALVPFYFLDSLLLIRFSEAMTLQIQAVGLAILYIALALLGVPVTKMTEAAPHHFTLPLVAMAVCVISLGFAAATVWRLDRQSY